MASEPLKQNRLSFALMPTLVASIGTLALLSVGSILAINWTADRHIVQELANRLITRTLATEEMALRHHLDAAIDQANFIAAAIRDGRYQFSERSLGDFVSGTIAAAPQVDGLIVSDTDGHALRVLRDASGTGFQLDRLDISGDPQLAALASKLRERKAPDWGPPIFRERTKSTYLNYSVPIWNGNVYLGFVVVAISTRALSSFTTGLSDPPRSVSFLLYGHDRVLAHPFMTDGASRQSVASPLPTLESFGDPVIANLFRSPPPDEVGLTSIAGVLAREPSVAGVHYFVFARQIEGYGDQPITVGTYFLRHAVDAPLRLFYWATVLALFMFGISLIAAAVMAAAIARPIRRAASGATAIGNLDFDQVAPLSGSRFREINSLARSFNAMLDGLRAFGRYVPRTLVTRLVKEGRIGAGTEERVLAIMFTDIVGFTAACEKMSAGEVAAFINQHLTLVSACVEQEGGTIDKFIGDAVMAFWGAPGHTENPAASACRAAIAIQRALAADNAQRIARGLAPVRIRIGIHMGPVVVGDIGAPNRINYTIVGDAVNATQRLESLGKTVEPDAEAITLVSQEISAALPPGFQLISRGKHLVKGKAEGLDVYQLVGGLDQSATRVHAG